jgi:acetylglutamate kinase
MSYAGWTNKSLVSKLNAMGIDAVGLSGADGNVIVAEKRKVTNVDYGYAGDILQVHTKLVTGLLQSGFVPTFCAITHDSNGQLLNTNADTIASRIAMSLCDMYRVSLRFCFEHAGVLKDPQSGKMVIPKIRLNDKEAMIQSGTISDGMLPKIDNAFMAKKYGVHEVSICGIQQLNNLDNATRFYE